MKRLDGGDSADNENSMERTVPARYFVDLYLENADPWNFTTSEYEHSKYQTTLAALPRERYRNACELGCSIGVFTQLLAQRCDRLVAVDVSEKALESARERCRSAGNVTFEKIDLLESYPEGTFDLTTVCELGYYFSRGDLDNLCRRIVAHSEPGATILLVHFTPPAPGHALPAGEVHERFRTDPQLRHIHGFDRSTYRLDAFERLSQ